MSDSNRSLMPGYERWYWRLRQWMTPGLLNAQYAYFATLEKHLEDGDRWLDLGCGRYLLPTWMRDHASIQSRLIRRSGEVVGIDPDRTALADNELPIIKHLGLAEKVPEPDASFDLITANMVVEHLDDPISVLREAARLLRPGGRLLIHTPNVLYPVTFAASCVPSALRTRITSWLEKRPAKDIYPTRYGLNHPAAIRRAAREVGLEVQSMVLTSDSPESVRLGPLVAIELALISLLRTRFFSKMQSNIVVVLRKHEVPCTVADHLSLTTTQWRDVRSGVAGEAA